MTEQNDDGYVVYVAGPFDGYKELITDVNFQGEPYVIKDNIVHGNTYKVRYFPHSLYPAVPRLYYEPFFLSILPEFDRLKDD